MKERAIIVVILTGLLVALIAPYQAVLAAEKVIKFTVPGCV